MKSNTVVDEESDDTTDLPSHLVETDQLTSDGGNGDFRDVGRGKRRSSTNSKTSKGTSTVDGSKSSRSGGNRHDYGSDLKEDSTYKDSPLAPKEETKRVA